MKISMQKMVLFVTGTLVLAAPARLDIGSKESRAPEEKQPATGIQPGEQSQVAEELHLAGQELISYQTGTGTEVMLFPRGFATAIGPNQLFGENAVVWLKSVTPEPNDTANLRYKGLMYLRGHVSVKKAKGVNAADLRQVVVEGGQAIVIQFGASGEVFVTADKRQMGDTDRLELYTRAFCTAANIEPRLQPTPEALAARLQAKKAPVKEAVSVKPVKVAAGPAVAPRSGYPLNIAPAGEVPPKVESAKAKDGTDIATIIGRVYLWWQVRDEKTGRLRLLELQADNAVIFYSEDAPKDLSESGRSGGVEGTLVSEAVKAVYVSGDVVMTEGQRTIQADQIYYDLERKKALVVDSVMRTFDVNRGIPIYVRAAKLRQTAENQFAAEDITLTTSEFHLPQISLNASSVVITDTTPVDEQTGKISDSSFDVQMQDVCFNMYDKKLLCLPGVRSNLQRPDVPLKGVHAGHDSTWGTSLETRWYLARLLGLQESEGTDSTITLDYYSKRGFGSGVELDYQKEDYFGKLLGYIIDDHGEDRLGRHSDRKDLEPPRELRGRFHMQHRHFLPYNWQLTAETSYASDKNFLEQYYRSEFNTDKEQETIVHMKRLEDNWALSLLGKWRLNDFADGLEELPTAEFHWTGQSFLDDRLTLYSDNQISRLRQRPDSSGAPLLLQDFFTYMSSRNELDMPMAVGKSKVVPFVAGTLAYEDGQGFWTDIDGSQQQREDGVWLGEAGVRVAPQPYWQVYSDIKSRLWDLNKLRHVIRPQLTAVAHTQSNSVVEQRDILNVGISQRLQTKRGPADKQRTVDWMRLDLDVTWVNDSSDTFGGPDRFIWNQPFVPLLNRYDRRFGQTVLPPRDRRTSDMYGPRRNYVGADYIWRLSDNTAVLSDCYFDTQSGTVEQFNVGFSRLRWPNLSYYIGSRYLRRLDNNLGEKGSNALTFAATYVLDPRYTVVFSQQFDLDYGLNIRSDVTLIRRYHRICFGLTYSADESLDRHAVVLSLWPEGVPELAIGPRRYMGIGSLANY